MFNDLDFKKIFPLMTFESGEEETCRKYMETRGIYLYKQVYDALATWMPNVKEIKYKQFSNLIRYDKGKQLGVYFIGKETLSETKEGTTNETKKKEFAYKLLEYLWDDVAKYNHSDWFGPDVKTLDQLIEEYMAKGQEVFVDGILK